MGARAAAVSQQLALRAGSVRISDRAGVDAEDNQTAPAALRELVVIVLPWIVGRSTLIGVYRRSSAANLVRPSSSGSREPKLAADEPGWAAERPTRGDENVVEREKVQTGSTRT